MTSTKRGSARAMGSGTADARAPGSRTRPAIGTQVRRLRTERGMTLSVLAERSGLNVGYLSQIENDKASPSLETLAALAEAIEVPVHWFLLATASPPRVVRAVDRRRWKGPGGVDVEEVDGGIPRDIRVVVVTSRPGQRTGLHAHAGDEHHIVLAGRVRLEQGGNTAELDPGDYLLWDATLPHDAETIGEEPSTLLIISHRAHGTETARPEG
ncbi:MAG TPA: helix-turn-helix domain-containing protein [Candidatus Limnocylindrales bacterium]|nr:helix-turn-helix domain-containing protein [Candidatus Limnocylindrales bacterium]